MKCKTVLLIMSIMVPLAGVLVLGQQPSSPQQPKKMYGAILCCDVPIYVSDQWIGTDRQRSCRDYLKNAPEGERTRVCSAMTRGNAFSKATCIQDYSEFCPNAKGPDDEPECEKPTPWFGTPPASCKDVQSPVVSIDAGGATLSICGFRIFRWEPSGNLANDPLLLEAYRKDLEERLKNSVGSKVCCDKFRAASGSRSKCNPRADVDCDGIPNDRDILRNPPLEGESLFSGTPFPSIDKIFSTPNPPSVDPFPPGLDPDDTDFFPPQDKCDCKWELVKGTLTCSPDGKQRHVYQAHWRCPSTGNERFTRKTAPATAPCKGTG